MSTSLPGKTLASLHLPITNKNNALFAVLHCGNHQYKTAVGDVIYLQHLSAGALGDTIAFKKILMIGGAHYTAIGRPYLAHARVLATIEEHHKKMRNKVSLFRTPGRRMGRWVDMAHTVTTVRVTGIRYEPVLLGELDKYHDAATNPNTSEAMSRPLIDVDVRMAEIKNPVYADNDGYDTFYKKDWAAVEQSDGFIDWMTLSEGEK
ncbi:large subunit ribosomal protein L21 [Strigomonas culicis]|uniref:Large ribosomal subunit protein bL21m n=1 Tax=Strigomonas culicis TaxID=28005 RepID=S9VAE4_9TRYP|nr:large subunit ribosomal protein L21 [Strigomonas culicis]EPY31014.1 large subunit ribosomal protein L21 [Strigomonas culicis]|eukprot:EPY23966.1 large subunit ribosomal protein L21 [Strigomonas culicis]